MSGIERDEVIENRILTEVIVDAFGSEEQSIGWYYYLAEKIEFPFQARCIQTMTISPLQVGEIVQIVGMISEDDCLNDMFVEIEWLGREFGVPLSQLVGIDIDKNSEEAISDWHYWVGRGYLLAGY